MLLALTSIESTLVIALSFLALVLWAIHSYRTICREDARRRLRRENTEDWAWPERAKRRLPL